MDFVGIVKLSDYQIILSVFDMYAYSRLEKNIKEICKQAIARLHLYSLG